MKKNSKKTSTYALFALLGAMLIGVLILSQISFHEYMKFYSGGYAVESGTVAEYLGLEPQQMVEKEVSIPMCEFQALDVLFEQGERLFLGEKKKTQVDMDFPVFLNKGASLQLVNDKSVLFTSDFEEVETYKGMILTDGVSYNMNGDRADAAEYTFLQLSNGNHVNLVPMLYEKKGETKQIAQNSFVHFSTQYLVYYTYEEGSLVYHALEHLTPDFIFSLNGNEYTYEELLIALGLGMPSYEHSEEPETELPENTENTQGLEEETETQDEGGEASSEVEDVENEPDEEQENKDGVSSNDDVKPGNNENKNNGIKHPGVRPDSMRPDKLPSEPDDKEEVEAYIKPTVTVSDFSAGVYRLMTEITVTDPASRIDKSKQVQFLVYRVADEKERLVMRSYQSRSGQVVLGNGMIEPDTKYHVVSFFTYANEYDEIVEEALGDWLVATKTVDTLGSIAMEHTTGIPYSNYFTIEHFTYDEAESDEEAVYGIATQAGMTIEITQKGALSPATVLTLKESDIVRFKKPVELVLSTGYTLKPKTTYEYVIKAEDFFGNQLTLTNAVGEATTSKNLPTAKMSIKTNEIKKLVLNLTITDDDCAVVPVENNTGDYEVYVVFSTADTSFSSKEEMREDDTVAYSYKLQATDFSISQDGALEVSKVPVEVNTLRIGTSYYATVYCDYDLDNGAGVKRFAPIGQLNFTTQDFSKLGKVYVDAAISDITDQSVTLALSMNTKMTNAQLIPLPDEMVLEIQTVEDEPVLVKTLTFGPQDTIETAEGKTQKLSEIFQNGGVIQYDNIDLTKDGTFQSSARNYELKMSLYTHLEEEAVLLDSELTPNSFMTMKQPATVEISNLVFAAGVLQLDVYVDDPDEAIIGNSGDKVVVYLYTNTGSFVKVVRISKNMPQSLLYTDLDPAMKYELRFIAVEYNEGYTNDTYESNKVLWSEEVENSLSVTGTIKLLNLKETGTERLLNAQTRVSFTDSEYELSGGNLPYYIRVEKDGQVVSDIAYMLSERLSNGLAQKDTSDASVFRTEHDCNDYGYVDQGDFTYKYTLYVTLNNKEIILDTMTITSEDAITGFSTAYEMIKYITAKPDGRFVAQNDIVFHASKASTTEYFNYQQPGNTDYDAQTNDRKRGYISILNGEVDFQGFTMETHFHSLDNYTGIFGTIAGGASIGNMKLEVYFDYEGAYFSMGGLSYRCEGTIHDVMVEYKGGVLLAENRSTSFFTYINCAGGVIENFVIKNAPQEGRTTFSTHSGSGLVTSNNRGTIRYGYVYGEPIYCTNTAAAVSRSVGAIAGQNGPIGKIYSVYSLVAIEQAVADVENNPNGYTFGYQYGSICGYSSGSVQKVYAAVDHLPVENKSGLAAPFNGTQTSPLIGNTTGSKYNKMYYYSPSDYKCTSKYSTPVTLDYLYDTGWQTDMLSAQFDVGPVEVGYYPQVRLSEELPEQEYIALPAREHSEELTISQANVQNYYVLNEGTENEIDAATVRFVFYNPNRYTITSVKIAGLTVALDLTTTTFADGYTTILGEVSNPQTFHSVYEVEAIEYLAQGVKSTYELPDPYEMSADFYRRISTADEWYTYVVLNAKNGTCENIRIAKDIDFTGVESERIMVTGSYTAKLTGTKKEDGSYTSLKNIDLQKDFDTASNSQIRNLFSNALSVDGGAEISNLYIDNYRCGGAYTENGITYVAKNAAVFYKVEGTINNVHLRNAAMVSYAIMGGMAANLTNGGEMTDCTIVGLQAEYKEPSYLETNIRFGGIAGYMSQSRMNHCFVRDLQLEALELKGSDGVGGVVGYASDAAINTVYATGDIITRATIVGGAVGQYVSTAAEYVGCKNVYADVDITTYTDVCGGLFGLLNVPTGTVIQAKAVSGVAFGNVYSFNPDAQNVGHVVGQEPGGVFTLYGSKQQVINGQLDSSDVSHEIATVLLSRSELAEDAVTTYRKKLHFDNVYQYSTEGILPKMLNTAGTALLPGQVDIPLEEADENEIAVYKIDVSSWKSANVIVVQLYNPKHYRIDGLTSQLKFQYAHMEGSEWVGVDDLSALTEDKYHEYVDDSVAEYTRLYLKYNSDSTANAQDYYLDSYILSAIRYRDNFQITQYIETNARIGVTLYNLIRTEDEWNSKMNRGPEHDYENYQIRAANGLDFSTCNITATDLKIGRLYGSPNDIEDLRTIRNIQLKKGNLIARLNSRIENINFENITIDLTDTGLTDEEKSYLMSNVGIIGASSGRISNCTFSDIAIRPFKSYSSGTVIKNVGIIGYQNGNILDNIKLENVFINVAPASIQKKNGIVSSVSYHRGNVNYAGGLCGYMAGVGNVNNITGKGLYVGGASYLGGVAGCIYQSNLDEIHVENVIMDSGNTNIGGIIGRLGEGSANNIATVKNVSVKGTLSWTDDTITPTGAVTSRIRGGSYVGGLFGVCYQKIGKDTYSQDEANTATAVVDGVLVRGKTNYIGGAMGYSYLNAFHIMVKNSVVQSYATEKKDSTNYNYIGGVIGYNNSNGGYYTVDNTFIAANLMGYVGGAVGIQNGGTIKYVSVRNSLVRVNSKTSRAWKDQYVGGIAGRIAWAHIYYSGTVNTSVLAKDSCYVGGVAGWFSDSATSGYWMKSCYCIGDVDTNAAIGYEAVARDTKVEGYQYVGGMIGAQKGGYLHNSYTNLNVSANYAYPDNLENKGTACGGLVGYYENNYTGEGTKKSYSIVKIYENYFAGTVTCNRNTHVFAGGLIGATSLKWNRPSMSASRVAGSTGAYSEMSYTYSNIILSPSIAGGGGTKGGSAQAICGQDAAFVGKNNRIWESMQVNGEYAGDLYASYAAWAPQTDKSYYQNKPLLFAAKDLKSDGVTTYSQTNLLTDRKNNVTYNTFPANAVFYRYLDGTWAIPITTPYVKTQRDFAWRFHISTDAANLVDVTTRYPDNYEVLKHDGPGEYLPQNRSQSSSNAYKYKYNEDLSVLQQNIRGAGSFTVKGGDTKSGLLPVPADRYQRASSINLNRLSGIVVPETYGIVYASDADTINLEFSSDLVGYGYYQLFVGDTSISGILPIQQRVYTYDYDFANDLRLEYGVCEEDGSYSQIAMESYEIENLRRVHMVYGDDYAYIDDNGAIVTGVHGTFALQGEDTFLHMMNGRAIDCAGNVWKVFDWTKEAAQISDCKLRSDAKALYHFIYENYEIDTFARFSVVASDNTRIERDMQIFVDNGEMYMVDGTMENVKDAILLYHLNGVTYQTILGNDGFVADMRQSDVNLPEGVNNAAIAQMSNTIFAKVPYVILEYSNGGMIGYNYATGAILFDNRKSGNVALIEYVKDFFTGEKASIYAGLSSSYQVNHEVAETIKTTEELENLIGYDALEEGTSHDGIESAVTDAGNLELTNPDDIAAVDKDNIGHGEEEAVLPAEDHPDTVEGTGNDETVEGDKHEACDTLPADGLDNSNDNWKDEASVNIPQEQGTSGDNASDLHEDSATDENSDADSDSAFENEAVSDASNDSAGDSISDSQEPLQPKNEKLMAVFNEQTGEYELVVIERYLTDKTYQSENARLGISNLAQVVNGESPSGYASATIDNSQRNGVRIYVVAIGMIAALGAGVSLFLHKKHKR